MVGPPVSGVPGLLSSAVQLVSALLEASLCRLSLPPHLQFFVASDPTVKTDRLWHDKYTLRTSMIPSFMTMDQSRKVGSRGPGVSAPAPSDKACLQGAGLLALSGLRSRGEVYVN